MAKYKVEINGIDTNKLKVLTNDEMITLFKEYQKGNQEAKEEIINGNLKLVLSIINKYSPSFGISSSNLSICNRSPCRRTM